MRSNVIKNKGHLIKAWVVWQVNKWIKIWTRTMYTCLCAIQWIFPYISFKMKTNKNYYYYFWLKSKFNWIWYFFIFLYEWITSFSRITLWKFLLKLYIMYLYWQDFFFIFFLLLFTINSILLKWEKKVCKVLRSSIELFSLLFSKIAKAFKTKPLYFK